MFYHPTEQRWKVKSGSGTGSGSGGVINYISLNPDAESSVNFWNTYNEGTGTLLPVDGLNGASVVTLTRSTTNSLRGVASFEIAKPASNSSGSGWSYDFVISRADRGKVLRGSFDYEVVSGSYPDDQYQVFLLDTVAGTLIYPTPNRIKNTGTVETYNFEFQTTMNTSYRLIFHCTSTNTTANTLRFDSFSVGPYSRSFGSQVSGWRDFASTAAGTLIKGVTTNPTYGATTVNKAQWRRVGGDMEITWTFHQNTAGTAGSGAYLFDISQLGLSIDTSKITPDTSGRTAKVGDFWNHSANMGSVFVYSSTQLAFAAASSITSSFTVMGSAYGGLSANPAYFNMMARVPIAGWSESNQVLSTDSDSRVCAFQVWATSALSSVAGQTIKYPTTLFDTHGGWSSATGLYTCQIAGIYHFGVLCHYSVASLHYYKNGVFYGGAGNETTADSDFGGTSILVDLKVGDTFSVISVGGNTFSGDSSYYRPTFWGFRLQGPSQVMASEKVYASYWMSSNKTPSTSQWDFDSREIDSHGCVTTGASWRFTAPYTATYRLLCFPRVANITASDFISLYKNNVPYKRICYMATSFANSQIATEFRLLAGEFIDIRCLSNFGLVLTGGTLDAAANITISSV
jgi:hypothetical protein